MKLYQIKQYGTYNESDTFNASWVFLTEGKAKKFFADLVEKAKAEDEDNGYDKYEEDENYYESWVDGEYVYNNIIISLEEIQTQDDKPYWAMIYDARQTEKDIEIGDKMTLKEVLDLGYSMTTVFFRETGENKQAGYLEEDGTYAIYDFPLEDLDKIIVEIAERYDDEDDYPCISTTFVERSK